MKNNLFSCLRYAKITTLMNNQIFELHDVS